MDTALNNKQVVEAVFAGLAQGDGAPFANAMAPDFSWTITGHGPWAGTWRGKAQVRSGLLGPLLAQFEGRYRSRARRIVADGDVVVVESRGDAVTKAGQRYDNHYCFVIEMRGGQLHALTEYMDTALAEAVLIAPQNVPQ